MNNTLRAVLVFKDPSLPLAVAAIIDVADADGSARFGDLAVAYRREYLELERRERGDVGQQRGVLSVDQVRQHLRASVLPRLATGGIIAATETSLEDGDLTRVETDVWADLKAGGTATRDELVHMAFETIREAEASADRVEPEPSGSILQGHGLTTSQGLRIYRHYGNDTVAAVRANPYRLASDVFGIGFKTADQLAARLEIARDAPIRMQHKTLAMRNTVKSVITFSERLSERNQ